jgi:hypothetical protein
MRFCGGIFLILFFSYGFLHAEVTGYNYDEALAKKMMFLAAGAYADTTTQTMQCVGKLVVFPAY